MESTEPFFDGIRQVEASLGGHEFKLPIFYRDASSTTAFFAARAGRVRERIPTSEIRLTTLAPGVAVVAITVFEYRDCDIGPYNELAVSFAATWGRRSIPFLSLVGQVRRRTVSAYVHRLPVTTEIARVGGVELYGYPKILAEIDYEHAGGELHSELRYERRRVMELSGPLPETSVADVMIRYVTYSMLGARPLETQVLVRARSLGEALAPRGVELFLDDRHPIATDLAEMLLSRRPFMVQHIPRFCSVLHVPSFLR